MSARAPRFDASLESHGAPALSDDTARLCEAAARGDREAVGQLVERYLPGLRAFVRLRAGPVIRARESSSDIVQSVCREVLEHIDRFQHPSDAAFKHWLYTTALRKIANRTEHWQAEKRDGAREAALGSQGIDGEVELAASYRTFSTPSGKAALKDEIERVERAFEDLSEEHREVITLAHLAGLTRAEIAERTGRNEDAVRASLYRGMARLSALLGAA